MRDVVSDAENHPEGSAPEHLEGQISRSPLSCLVPSAPGVTIFPQEWGHGLKAGVPARSSSSAPARWSCFRCTDDVHTFPSLGLARRGCPGLRALCAQGQGLGTSEGSDPGGCRPPRGAGFDSAPLLHTPGASPALPKGVQAAVPRHLPPSARHQLDPALQWSSLPGPRGSRTPDQARRSPPCTTLGCPPISKRQAVGRGERGRCVPFPLITTLPPSSGF